MPTPNQQTDQKRTALITGATGLVGAALVRQLLASEHYKKVITVGRRPLDLEHDKLQNEVADLGDLPEMGEKWSPDDVFCCLGTTIKKAGSKEQFRKVDYDYVMNTARFAEKSGAKRFLVVSAVGANVESSMFYSQVKGEVERDLKVLKLPEIHIFRPSMLLGDRKEFRLGEKIGGGLMWLAQPFFRGSLAKYHPISATKVAEAMYKAALRKKEGIHFYEYPEMSELV